MCCVDKYFTLHWSHYNISTHHCFQQLVHLLFLCGRQRPCAGSVQGSKRSSHGSRSGQIGAFGRALGDKGHVVQVSHVARPQPHMLRPHVLDENDIFQVVGDGVAADRTDAENLFSWTLCFDGLCVLQALQV